MSSKCQGPEVEIGLVCLANKSVHCHRCKSSGRWSEKGTRLGPSRPRRPGQESCSLLSPVGKPLEGWKSVALRNLIVGNMYKSLWAFWNSTINSLRTHANCYCHRLLGFQAQQERKATSQSSYLSVTVQILIQWVSSGAGESAFQQVPELPGKIADAQVHLHLR